MIPAYIRAKACAVADKIARGEVRPRRLLLTRKQWQVVDLSRRWRFISEDGLNWQVVSHEVYSKMTGRHRNVSNA